MVDQKEQGKAEIEDLFSQRIGQYTHAIIRSAIALDRNDLWKNCLTSVHLYDGEAPESRSLVYPGFEIHELVESPNRVLELVGHLVIDNKLYVGDRDVSLDKGRFDTLGHPHKIGRRVSSSGGWITTEWPGDQFLLGASREMSPPSDPLVSPGIPAYPNGLAAIKHVLDMEVGIRGWDGGVFFFFPDYRARIESVTLGTGSLSVRIKCKKLELSDLSGKVYASSKGGTILQPDIQFLSSEEKVELGFAPEEIYVGLLSNSDGEKLDDWQYSPHRPSSKLRIELFTPQYVQQLVAQGEDEFVEFKPGSKDENNKKEVAESAIAFANKSGGVILVGVDNNARIEGAFSDGWEELIAQSLRDRCEPPIDPTVRRVIVEDMPIYVIQVLESANKPHLLKGTGVAYIRVSSTDKPATRYELDELYENKTRHSRWPHNEF